MQRSSAVVSLLLVNAGVVWYHGDPLETLSTSPAANDSEANVVSSNPPASSPAAEAASEGDGQRVEAVKLERNQTAAGALQAAGVSSDVTAAALAALAEHVDFRRLRPGDRFTLRFARDNSLIGVELQRGATDRAVAHFDGQRWLGQRVVVPVRTVVSEVSGQVKTSLWDALVDSRENPLLVHNIVDIFAWEIDFYSQVYPGDTFRVLLEKRFVDDKFLEYGRVLAAEFVSAGEVHRGFLHAPNGEDGAYYDEKGNSMRRQLLKSPLKYGHVTSRFGTRRHPVLGYTRKHNGVDYGVPTGTPTWSVGDGKVVRAGWHGGYGRLVEVRHANGWLSQYAHLSQINVRVGQHIRQKQVVGLVGQTGLATGPHLHYGLQRHGAFTNPLAEKFERALPLAGHELERFRTRVVELREELNKIQVAVEPPAAGDPQQG